MGMCHLALYQDCSVHSCGFGRSRAVHITTKLTSLEYFCTWRCNQPCLFSTIWTTVFKYPSLGRYKFPLFSPHLKKGLFPQKNTASRTCMESRPTAYLWDKLRKCEWLTSMHLVQLFHSLSLYILSKKTRKKCWWPAITEKICVWWLH